jgi:hypothetical protein
MQTKHYFSMRAGRVHVGDVVELEMVDEPMTGTDIDPDTGEEIIPHHVEQITVLEMLPDYHGTTPDSYNDERIVFVGYRPHTDERIGWTWFNNQEIGRVWRMAS